MTSHTTVYRIQKPAAWNPILNRTLIFATLFALGAIFIPPAMGLTAPPPEIASAMRTLYPHAGSLQLMADVKCQGSRYFIVWLVVPSSGDINGGIVEATIKKNSDGSTEIVGRDDFSGPANNYLENPELCRALNDSFVKHMVDWLGGDVAMQKALDAKSCMVLQEAYAYRRAGFRLADATRISKERAGLPYTTAGELAPEKQ